MSGQRVLEIESLPESGIDASARFMRDHLDDAVAMARGDGVDALVIVLPAAGPDHADWRRALARDLARDMAQDKAPRRVNVVGGSPGPARDHVIDYLANAPGVTGQYLEAYG